MHLRHFLKKVVYLAAGSAAYFLPRNEDAEAAVSNRELEQSRAPYEYRFPNGTSMTYRILGARDALQDARGNIGVALDGVFGGGLKFSHSMIQDRLQSHNIAMITPSKYEGTSWTRAKNTMQWAEQVQQLVHAIVPDHGRKLAVLGYSAGGLDAVGLSILLGNRVSVCAVLAGAGDLANPANFDSLGDRRKKELNALRGLGIKSNPHTPRGPLRRIVVGRIRERIREKAEDVIGQKVANPHRALEEWLTHVTESDQDLVHSSPEMYDLMLQEFEIYDQARALDTFHRLFHRGINFGRTPKETIYYVRNGLEDTLVPPSHSKRTAASLKLCGCEVETEFVHGGHAEALANIGDFTDTFMAFHRKRAA